MQFLKNYRISEAQIYWIALQIVFWIVFQHRFFLKPRFSFQVIGFDILKSICAHRLKVQLFALFYIHHHKANVNHLNCLKFESDKLELWINIIYPPYLYVVTVKRTTKKLEIVV